MNRRSFFSKLAIGACAAPVAVMAAQPKAATRPGMKHIADVPKEAGKVNCMTLYQNRLWVGCDGGLYALDVEDTK